MESIGIIMNRRQIKLAHLNAQSINNKFDELKHFLAANNISIMSINENWLNAKSNINIPNYCIVRQDRENNKKGGGVCLIIHKNIRFTREYLP